MSLIEAIESQQSESRAQAYKRYVQLLSQDKPDAKAVAELQSLMHQLGKSLDDVRKDSDTIAQVHQLRLRIASGSGLDSQISKAIKAAESYREETQKLIQSRQIEQMRLNAVHADVDSRYHQAQSAVHALNRLIDANPELLVDQPPADIRGL